MFQNTDMSPYGLGSIPNRAGQITQSTKLLETKEAELAELKKSNEAVKYDIAKHIEKNIKHSTWSKYIDSLISMYKQVSEIGQDSADAIELSDFIVDQNRVWLKGRVKSLNTVYQARGVIDKMIQLDFISNIKIPSYQKTEWGVYEFQIQWDVDMIKK